MTSQLYPYPIKEDTVQIRVLHAINTKFRALTLHIANEGMAKVQWRSKLKQMGLVKGSPDLLVAWDGRVAFIEVKRPRTQHHSAGYLSKDQKRFKAKCEDLGIPYAMARSEDEAVEFLKGLGCPTKPIWSA